jgi:hypothetical protein
MSAHAPRGALPALAQVKALAVKYNKLVVHGRESNRQLLTDVDGICRSGVAPWQAEGAPGGQAALA